MLHFPSEVYQKIGASELLPQLLEIVKPEDLKCFQFLRGGKVRLSVQKKSVRDHYISEGLRFNGQDIPVTRDGLLCTFVTFPMRSLVMMFTISSVPMVTC